MRQALRHFQRVDPTLGAALKRVGPCPDLPTAQVRRMSHLAYLSRAIVSQQLAVKAADTIWRRYRRLGVRRSAPTAAEILQLPDATMRGAGLSRNKLAALRDLAKRVEDGSLRLSGLHRYPDEKVIQTLVEVRGIGVWTAQMSLIFKLGRLDVMPSGDLGVQEGVRRLDQLSQRPTPTELERRAEIWAPYRSVAAWTLWRILAEPGAS